jgi:TPP-dependent pyruvate/acetoin dehydrogenase alpha subunit
MNTNVEITQESRAGDELRLEMYKRMLLIRRFEEQAADFGRKGIIPNVVHTSHNQEAAVVGATFALRPDDYMTGNHRSHGHPIGKGAHLPALMAEMLGKATGTCKGKGGSMHLADFSVGSLGESGIVGSGTPVAVGAALSAVNRGTDQVALTFFGDGAANAGVLHESMNLAAVWELPVIFFCENNHWAVTTSVRDSTSVEDIAVRGAAYGMPGVKVDGQDVELVYAATSEAVARARAGGGPSLIEAKTYRIREHAEGLPVMSPYRTEAEVTEWQRRDPLTIMGERLLGEGLTQAQLDDIEAEAIELVEEAVSFAMSSPDPEPGDVYLDIYANPMNESTYRSVPVGRLIDAS